MPKKHRNVAEVTGEALRDRVEAKLSRDSVIRAVRAELAELAEAVKAQRAEARRKKVHKIG
jgi:hypothetical protein